MVKIALEVVNLARGRAARASTPNRHPKCRGRSSPRPPKGGQTRFFNQENERGERGGPYKQMTTTHVLSMLNPFVLEQNLRRSCFCKVQKDEGAQEALQAKISSQCRRGGASWQKASLYVRIELTTSRLTVSRSTN